MAAFVNDTFTDTNGTLLSAHTGETNATWAHHPAAAYSGHTAEISGNRARSTDASSTATAYVNNHASGDPATADYEVEAPVFQLATLVAGGAAGVCGRMDSTADTFYNARFTGGGVWELRKVVAATGTTLGSTVADTIGNGNSKTVKLRMVGDQISLYVDGALTIGPITDSAITAKGEVGFRLIRQELHLLSITATDVVAAAAVEGRRMMCGLG